MSTELSTAKQQPMALQQTDTSAVIQMIERAASNPDVDVDKLERLMQMSERMEAKRAEGEFNAAMTRAQASMGRVSADAVNPQTRSRYASYAALDRALRPIYTEAGFSLSFDTGEGAPQGYVRMLCHVSHSAGHSRTYHADIPSDGKGAKGNAVMTATHAFGAGTSYGMRYLLKMIFNVAIGEDDNDGNKPIELITESQAAEIEALVSEVGANKAAMLKYLKVGSIDDIPAQAFRDVVRMLEAKRKQS